MSDNVLRVLTALIGVPAVVGLLFLGGWPFTLLVLALALLAQHEVYQLMEAGGQRPYRAGGLLLGALLVLQVIYVPLLVAAAVLAVALIAASPFERRSLKGAPLGEHPEGVASLPATFFGALYPSALLAFLLAIRVSRGPDVGDLEAFYLALSVFVLVWSADTMAYYAGRAFGRRALAPAVSPKKTWEGAAGGVVGALAAAVLFRLLVLEMLPWVHVAAIGLIAGIVGPLGDLAESKMKRQVGVKDSGTLLPGHGGLLDRFDAMILVAPAVYVYLRYAAGVYG